ncbi:MAG: hypothetical protein HN368_08950 [Spirochaetales bacterium]|nr:hypothetical protein [Spirochaetales bacterium]
MELFFESRSNIKATGGKMIFEQAKPEITAEPVLGPDSLADGAGTSIYGTVLRDQGVYRMWYQAWPKDWDGRDISYVGYAESEDGDTWKKPSLGLVDHGGTSNNLCDLGFHSPSVYIDPKASGDFRYRGTGYVQPGGVGAPKGITIRGYYTAHSADGIHWQLDSNLPTWPNGDVITSIYHAGQERAIVSLKRHLRIGGIPRRTIWNAEQLDGEWSQDCAALLPDEFDDTSAISRGFVSGDYYGMGMMAAGQGTVGFIWQFRHSMPRTAERGYGVFGNVDVSLAYQEGRGHAWHHSPGRKDFIIHGETDWMKGGIYTSSCPVDAGDNQRLYFSGTPYSHGWYLDSTWQRREDRRNQMLDQGFAFIGYASWKRDRLFSYRADPDGTIDFEIHVASERSELCLNYAAEKIGGIRAEIVDQEGFEHTTSIPLTGDELSSPVRWKSGNALPARSGENLLIRLHVEQASIYSFEVRPIA